VVLGVLIFFDPEKRRIKKMNSGMSRRSLTKADKVAEINPSDGKSVNYLLFTYRQLFVDMVELSSYASSGTLPGIRGLHKGEALATRGRSPGLREQLTSKSVIPACC
jgi:hypothetical protein